MFKFIFVDTLNTGEKTGKITKYLLSVWNDLFGWDELITTHFTYYIIAFFIKKGFKGQIFASPILPQKV